MDQRGGGEADEVELLERRALAVQLGEVAEHAAAELAPGKAPARRRGKRLERRAWRPDAAGKGAFQVGRRATAAPPRTASRARATAAAERGDLRVDSRRRSLITASSQASAPSARRPPPQPLQAARGHARGAGRGGRSDVLRAAARARSARLASAASDFLRIEADAERRQRRPSPRRRAPSHRAAARRR